MEDLPQLSVGVRGSSNFFAKDTLVSDRGYPYGLFKLGSLLCPGRGVVRLNIFSEIPLFWGLFPGGGGSGEGVGFG